MPRREPRRLSCFLPIGGCPVLHPLRHPSPQAAPARAAAPDVQGLRPGVVLVLGGARSGKSAHAERLVEALGRPAVYVATGRAFDGEMAERIDHHRARRGADWTTVEAPLDLVGALDAVPPGAPVLVDCLTLWLTNLMLEDRDVPAESDRLCRRLEGWAGAPRVLVSNEVGLGIVPDNRLARDFRDHAGRLHQAIAALASTVHFVAAGLPLTLKG